MSQIVTIHTDGASRGNPGEAAIAFVIDRPDTLTVNHKSTIGLATNNQAEYRAMIAAMEKLVELEISDREITFLADSELMIKQIKGQYRVKDLNLRTLYDQVLSHCLTLKARSNELQFTAIGREGNTVADRLANEALDGNR